MRRPKPRRSPGWRGVETIMVAYAQAPRSRGRRRCSRRVVGPRGRHCWATISRARAARARRRAARTPRRSILARTCRAGPTVILSGGRNHGDGCAAGDRGWAQCRIPWLAEGDPPPAGTPGIWGLAGGYRRRSTEPRTSPGAIFSRPDTPCPAPRARKAATRRPCSTTMTATASSKMFGRQPCHRTDPATNVNDFRANLDSRHDDRLLSGTADTAPPSTLRRPVGAVSKGRQQRWCGPTVSRRIASRCSSG